MFQIANPYITMSSDIYIWSLPMKARINKFHRADYIIVLVITYLFILSDNVKLETMVIKYCT